MEYFHMMDILYERMYNTLMTAAAELDCQVASILHDIRQTVDALDVLMFELARKLFLRSKLMFIVKSKSNFNIIGIDREIHGEVGDGQIEEHTL